MENLDNYFKQMVIIDINLKNVVAKAEVPELRRIAREEGFDNFEDKAGIELFDHVIQGFNERKKEIVLTLVNDVILPEMSTQGQLLENFLTDFRREVAIAPGIRLQDAQAERERRERAIRTHMLKIKKKMAYNGFDIDQEAASTTIRDVDNLNRGITAVFPTGDMRRFCQFLIKIENRDFIVNRDIELNCRESDEILDSLIKKRELPPVLNGFLHDKDREFIRQPVR